MQAARSVGTLFPGRVTLGELRRVYRDRDELRIDPAARKQVEMARACVDAIVRRG